jgi:hypothetical protein
MEIVAGELDWTSTDEQNLLIFLGTPTGKRFIPRLAELAPVLLSEGETNKLLLRMGEFKGRQETLRDIFALSQSQPRQARSVPGYPPPEDDSLWNDGQKIIPLKE